MMTHDEIIQWCDDAVAASNVIEFPDDVFASLTPDIAVELMQRHGAKTLMILPKREQEFFAWLKANDEKVWNDLWSEGMDEAYVVSLAFLPAFLDASRGFPICDLEQEDNYFFVPGLVQGEHAQDFVEAVRDRFISNEKVTVEQLLALECSMSPIDIWHFAWHHGIELKRAKEAVHRLAEEKILLHLTSAADLAEYIE